VDGVVGPLTVAKVKLWDNRRADLANEIAARRALLYSQTTNLALFGLGWYRRLMTMTSKALVAQ
jgi:lysozyme family protein